MDDVAKTSQTLPDDDQTSRILSQQAVPDDQGQQPQAGPPGDDQIVPPPSPIPPPPQTLGQTPLAPPTFPVAPKPFDSAQGKLKEQPSFANAAVGEGGKVAIDYSESDKVAKAEGDEYWENYAREIELEKQILDMGGIEKVENGEIKIPEKVAAEMGVRPTTEIHTPMAAATGFSVSGVSLDDSRLSAGVGKPASSGFKWLVEWFIYQLLKAHFHVKRIRGKITREKAS